ncbi:MAG TPA: LacI family transcriptional regulator [Chloroflexi bacterium]|nr:LacI family transcriptional regulator [Chloroflexota bacterium]
MTDAVTIKDIARRVGKSVTTVSRALHGYSDVAPETRELVQRVAREMGYTPNVMAQRLQKQRAETLGLILPTFGPRFSDPFFSEFVAGVGNQAAERGYDLLLSTRAPGEEEMAAYRKAALGRRVDGFIIIRTRARDERIRFLQQIGFPFVAFGRTASENDFPYVDEDGVEGMRQIAHHLADLGHRRIGYLSPPLDLMFAQHRLEGLRRGLAERGLALDEAYLRIGALTEQSGYALARELLTLPVPPTALACGNDLMAIGAMRAAQERGLKIGREIAISGFDDIPLAQHTFPPLTTVHQPIYQIGKRVASMLIDLVEGNPLAERQVLLKPQFVVRQSTLP